MAFNYKLLSLNVLQYNLFQKIITLAIAPFLFISVGVLCKFEEHIHKKDLNLCLPLYYYAKVTVELTQTWNSTEL